MNDDVTIPLREYLDLLNRVAALNAAAHIGRTTLLALAQLQLHGTPSTGIRWTANQAAIQIERLIAQSEGTEPA